MPHKVWRVGRKVPMNVYAGDRPVCQCHTEAEARNIVAAMNAWLATQPEVTDTGTTPAPQVTETATTWRQVTEQDFAPPGRGYETVPHAFRKIHTSSFCRLCRGGRLHSIHDTPTGTPHRIEESSDAK